MQSHGLYANAKIGCGSPAYKALHGQASQSAILGREDACEHASGARLAIHTVLTSSTSM